MNTAANPSANASDRLVSTLFLATVLHGIVIMGITFKTLNPNDFETTPTLEVVLVQNPDAVTEAPDEASYLAAQAQDGAGNTEERVRASGSLSTGAPLDQDGVATGVPVPPADPATRRSEQDLLVTPKPSDRTVQALVDAAPDPRPQAADPLLMEASPNPLILDETDGTLRATSETLRETFIAVDTREAVFAGYLSSWKRKIEDIGTLNFPDQANRAGLKGNPVLEVAIRADGSLHEIIVRRSSGHSKLDQAALRILRLAAPFDPFPGALKDEFDVLRFVYEWQFLDGIPVRSTLTTTAGGGT